MKLTATLSTLAMAAIVSVAAPMGHAAIIEYHADLSGPNEAPPNASLGTGTAVLLYDSTAHTLAISATWTGLGAPTTVAHIHCCTPQAFQATTAGVAVTPTTLPGFPGTGNPPGLTAGTYSIVLDLTAAATYTAAFVTGFAGGVVANAEAAIVKGFNDHTAYFNIHTTAFPNGEIRGFVVPEPAMLALLGLGLAGLGLSRRSAS